MYIACLSAGRSSRLLPLTKIDHKAMLRIGDLRIIDAQLRTFDLAGIQTLSFVVGHGGLRLTNHLLKRYSQRSISIINNNYFASRNLDWSAYLALSSRPGDVIYYEGDVIASPSIIRQLATHQGDVCLAMDPVGQSEKIDTRVISNGNRVQALQYSEHGSLARDAKPSEGEFLCLVKLSDRARMYVLALLERVSFVGPMRMYEIFNRLFKRYPSYLFSTAGRPWVEIDTRSDLHRAKRLASQVLNSC